jgi:hypothetical protein
MNYYVFGPDGTKYGPVDANQLQQWAMEGRVLPFTKLEDAATRQVLFANQLPRLVIPGSAQAMPTPQNPAQQPRQNYIQQPFSNIYRVTPEADIAFGRAWTCFQVGIALFVPGCCLGGPIAGTIPAGIGIFFAVEAQRQGHPKAASPKTANIILIVVLVVLQVLGGVLLNSLVSGLGPK